MGGGWSTREGEEYLFSEFLHDVTVHGSTFFSGLSVKVHSGRDSDFCILQMKD